VTKPQGSDGGTALGLDAARVRGIEWYLNTHHALGELAPWFEGHDPNPFAEGKTPEETSREVLAALSLRSDIPNSAGLVYFTHYSDLPTTVSLGGNSHVIGPWCSRAAARFRPPFLADPCRWRASARSTSISPTTC
jgi:hypothetical protein